MSAAVAASALAFLLWPLEDARDWAIRADQKLLEGKRHYLAAIKPIVDRSPPNIVLILADDLAREDLTLYNDEASPTPNIDALAHAGTTYTSAFSTAPICAPSRAALLTGRYQNRFGFETQPVPRYAHNRIEYLGFRFLIDTDAMRPVWNASLPTESQRLAQGLPSSEITFAEALQRAGYRTGVFGKWHLGNGDAHHPRHFGFDEQYGFMEAFSMYADENDAAIENHVHDLFWEHHIRATGRNGLSAITRDGNVIDEDRYLTDAIASEAIRFMQDSVASNRPFLAYLPFNAPHTPFQARREDFDAIVDAPDHNTRVYRAMIRRLDWAVGEIMAQIESLGIADRTLVVFASDNGGATYTGATGSGGLRAGKFTQFDGGIAIPLAALIPGAPSHQVDGTPRLLADVYTTLLSAAGIEPASDRPIDAIDLARPAPIDRALFWRSDFNKAIRHGRFKLVLNTRDGSQHLFDLARDPAERDNRVLAAPEDAARLRRELDEFERDLTPAAWPRVMDYLDESDGERLWFAI